MFRRLKMKFLPRCLVLVLVLSSLGAPSSFAQTDDSSSPDGQLQQKLFLPVVRSIQGNQQATEDDPSVAAGRQQAATFTITNEQAQSAEAFWSRAARLAAKAAPAPLFDRNALQAEASAAGMVAQGAPGFSGSRKPAINADTQARQEFAEEWAQIAADQSEAEEAIQAAELSEVTGTSNVYTTYLGNFYNELWQTFPYRATGKLYSSVGSCSASVVSPNNIIVTAAHCVYNTNTNQLYSNILFVPAERNGARPYGSFSANLVAVLNGWINLPSNQVSRFDVALVRLNNNASGRSVTFYTGNLGRSWNFNKVQSITEIGYPSNLPSGSLYTYVGHAETFDGGTELLNFGSNMGFGASGSPLIRLFAPSQGGSRNSVYGVQSGSSPNGTSPVHNIAPQFTTNTIVTLCNLIGC